MTSFRRYAALLGLILASCTPQDRFSFFIPPDAERVDRHQISGDSRQLSYSKQVAFPESAVPEGAWTELRESGWKQCASSQQEWEVFLDASRGDSNASTVFQKLSYWRKSDSLLSISQRYRSGTTVDGRALPTPDNDVQLVLVIEDKVDDTVVWKELKCS